MYRCGRVHQLALELGTLLNCVNLLAIPLISDKQNSPPNTGEHNLLLGSHHGTSNSDVSTHLCEIDDSECEQESTKSVKWAPSVQSTQV